jgi:hypothetical protein
VAARLGVEHRRVGRPRARAAGQGEADRPHQLEDDAGDLARRVVAVVLERLQHGQAQRVGVGGAEDAGHALDAHDGGDDGRVRLGALCLPVAVLQHQRGRLAQGRVGGRRATARAAEVPRSHGVDRAKRGVTWGPRATVG